MPIAVLIVEDRPLVAAALVRLANRLASVEVLDEPTTLHGAVVKLAKLRTESVVVLTAGFGGFGSDLVALTRLAHASGDRVVLLVDDTESLETAAAVRGAVRGLLHIGCDTERVEAAMHAVAEGHSYRCPVLGGKL